MPGIALRYINVTGIRIFVYVLYVDCFLFQSKCYFSLKTKEIEVEARRK